MLRVRIPRHHSALVAWEVLVAPGVWEALEVQDDTRAMSLSGTARHVVLITTGVADTCSETDNPCLMDPSIKAVQDAQKAGITTHVIGMGDTGLLDTGNDQDGYQTYLKQLANAGAGKSVKKSAAFDEKCSDDKARATYSNDDGDAKAYRAESTSDVKAAVAEIFKSICP